MHMSSAFKGHWLNGSKETGFTAEAFEGPNNGKKIVDCQTGQPLKLHLAGIKRAIVTTEKPYEVQCNHSLS